MLFLQGTRDALADIALMRKLAKALGKRATLIASRAAIIPSMCPHALDGTMPMSEAKCWTRSPAGSKPCPRVASRCSSLLGANRYAPFGAS